MLPIVVHRRHDRARSRKEAASCQEALASLSHRRQACGPLAGASPPARAANRRRCPLRCGLARALFHRRERLPDPPDRRRHREVARGHRPHGQACRRAWRVHHRPWRRHVAGRAGGWSGAAARYLEVLQPPSRVERARALGDRRAGHRARRAERRAEATRRAIRAGHLHGESRHHRRHDQQQLVRCPVRPVREDDRSCARAGGGALGWITGPSPPADWPGTRSCLPRRHPRGDVLPDRAPGREGVRG